MRNLKSDVTEEQLKEKFEPYGTIERIKKIKDYGFVHFKDREECLKAMAALNNSVSIISSSNGCHFRYNVSLYIYLAVEQLF